MIYDQDLCSDGECLRHRHCKRWKKWESGKWRDKRVLKTCIGYIAFIPVDSKDKKKNKTMREIKFRAKRQDRDEWVYGDLTHVQKICKPEEVERTGKRSMPAVRVGNYDVREETIGQYTGLRDYNAKEIYEGDILEFSDTDGYRHLKTVVFDKGAFCFKHTENNALTPLKSHQWWKYTVAGNIYDSIN